MADYQSFIEGRKIRLNKWSKDFTKLPYDIKLVKELRELSGAEYRYCIVALYEAENDIEKAMDILREKVFYCWA